MENKELLSALVKAVEEYDETIKELERVIELSQRENESRKLRLVRLRAYRSSVYMAWDAIGHKDRP